MSVSVHEAICFDGFQDRLIFYDDFEGDSLKDEWDITGSAGGSGVVVDGETGGIVRLTTGGNGNNFWQLDWNDIRSLIISKRVVFEARFKLSSTASIRLQFYLRETGNQVFKIDYDTNDGDTNWQVVCQDNGPATDLDSGVAADTSYHIFRIESHIHGGNHIHFYIDGIETSNSPISTNLPNGPMQPRIYLQTRTGAAKSVDIDYIIVRQDR